MEQAKFIKPVDTAIGSIFLEGDPDLTTYPNEVLGTNKAEQQRNAFSFLTPKGFGKT